MLTVVLIILLTLSYCHAKNHACGLHNDQQYGLFADCKGRQLQHIPYDLPCNITALDISENILTSLSNGIFQKFPNLTYLNLNSNSLSQIESGVFRGLFNLTVLLLARNKLDDSFPDDIFHDLKNLHTLNLEKNGMTSYPDRVFPPLINLHSLYLDSIPEPVLGSGFSKLANLKVLQIDSRFAYGGDCSIEKLKNTTFQSLNETRLEVLIMNHCNVKYCETGVLKHLMFLKHLELCNNGIGIQKSLHLLYPFVGRNMSRIWFDGSFTFPTQHKGDIDDHVITSESTKYLTQICVSELSLRQNGIYLIETGSVNKDPFRGCIEVLDVSKNIIVGDVGFFVILAAFSRLKYFDISYQRQVYDVPSRELLASPAAVALPQNLVYFDATGVLMGAANTVFDITFYNTDNLKTFLCGYNHVEIKRVHGLEHVDHVDVLGNDFGAISYDFFQSFSNVRKLSMKNCNLQNAKDTLTNPDIFRDLKEIEHLDLSSNALRIFPVIPNPGKLIELNLSHNVFDTIPLEYGSYTSLALLDMSFNIIGELSKDTRSSLEVAAERNSKMKIKVQGNIFSCGCENLDFILWLMVTTVIYESDRNFPCIQDNGTTTGTVDVARNYQSIHRYCTGKLSLSLTVTFMTVFVTSIVMTYVVSKNPTRYRNIVMKMMGFGVQYLTPKEFEYTFYVGYCEADIPFVYQKLRPALELCNSSARLFLKDREVLPGVVIADGIICGFTNSWKSVLVISDDFLEDRSQWSQFTIDAALYSMTDLIPNRIIVLLVGAVQMEDLPESLLNVVEEECILRVDDYQDGDETLWKELRKTAGI
ncbi:toll-like receptor 3 [Haliotis rufescens]|uniref:toll-like receptor 3 n=1 Tax=Haliotis rufescens TaxID=6454 RepID=UPI00201F0DA8|nr:toll-like receptor 3 [Haliotis rufescens]